MLRGTTSIRQRFGALLRTASGFRANGLTRAVLRPERVSSAFLPNDFSPGRLRSVSAWSSFS